MPIVEFRDERPSDTAMPGITTVIATRDRGARVLLAVESIFANRHPRAEVVVVDQSRERDTEAAVEKFLDRTDFKYIRSETKGISAGRNLGVEHATHDLIAFTDDDCLVAGNWLPTITEAFASDTRVGLVFGAVLAIPTDPSVATVTSYQPRAPALTCRLQDKSSVNGISSCMAVRRSVWRVLGGFDEQLGVGAPYRSGEETDLTLRTLAGVYFVRVIPTACVTHTGVCPLKEIPVLIDRNWFGTGAAWGKLLKQRPLPVIGLLVHMAHTWAFGAPPISSALGPRLYRTRRLRAFARGLATGLRHPVDPKTHHFLAR